MNELMEKTTSNAVQLKPGQFELLHALLNQYRFDMKEIDFGDREYFWICSNDWLRIKDKHSEDSKIQEFFQGLQKILQPGQILIIQSIGCEGLAFPFLASQVCITPKTIKADGFFNGEYK